MPRIAGWAISPVSCTCSIFDHTMRLLKSKNGGR
jgi:hypothetical protein